MHTVVLRLSIVQGVAQDPMQPNLRQVHLLHSELFNELKIKGFELNAGQIGENITTLGIDLLALPKNTIFAYWHFRKNSNYGASQSL